MLQRIVLLVLLFLAACAPGPIDPTAAPDRFVVRVLDHLREARRHEPQALALTAGAPSPEPGPELDSFFARVETIVSPHLAGGLRLDASSLAARENVRWIYMSFLVDEFLPLYPRSYRVLSSREYDAKQGHRARVLVRFEMEAFGPWLWEITLQQENGAWKLCRWPERAPADLAGDVVRGLDLPSLRESFRRFRSPILTWHGRYGEDRVYRVRLPFKDADGGLELLAIRRASDFELLAPPRSYGPAAR